MNLTLGHDEYLISFGDLSLSFKVTAVLNKANLSVCVVGEICLLKTIMLYQ